MASSQRSVRLTQRSGWWTVSPTLSRASRRATRRPATSATVSSVMKHTDQEFAPTPDDAHDQVPRPAEEVRRSMCWCWR